MGILNKTNVKHTGACRVDDSSVRVKIIEQKTDILDDVFPVQKQYSLALTVETHYWANDAQVDRSRQIAERALLAMLYCEISPRVDWAIHAIHNGDIEKALYELEKIRSEIFSAN